MKRNIALFLIVLCLLMAPLLRAQQQPKLQEEVVVRWWLVPVYAVDKAGAPVLNLAPEDLEIYIKDIKVEQFSLIKKQFQVTEAKRGGAAVPQALAPAQKKMVFLVFDAAFSPYNLLAKAKAIADTVIAQSDKSAQYVLLSIEPFAGLKYICGPTQDLNLIAKSMKKYIAGKKQDYMLESSDMDRGGIGNVYPGGDQRNPNWSARMRMGGARSYSVQGHDADQRNDWRDKKRVASSFMSSLMTLNLVLGNFREYSKVIYLYSCGIPGDALLDRTERLMDPLTMTWSVSLSVDTVSYDSLKMIGEYFNKSGALLFLVNPAGTWIQESDKDSGEQSLRILAAESGGRYFEGAEKQIAQEVDNMEGGYYEISFPDKPEYEGQELNFEIRSKKPEVTIFTVKKVGREKSYTDMTELEKEVLVLNILNQGPYAQTMQKVNFVEGKAFQDGGSLVCQMPLPPELARSEWSVFKIRRNFDTGAIQIEREEVTSESQSLEVRMNWKGKEFRHDIVLAHVKTGTILVWK